MSVYTGCWLYSLTVLALCLLEGIIIIMLVVAAGIVEPIYKSGHV